MSGNESKIPVGTNLVGKYRVVREIGRGGMAAVYEAEQLSLGKKVAVKVLASELAASTIVIERFFREARAAASVRSPYIVDVYDSGRLDDGRPFITMELLEGESLYDRMARIRLIDVETTIRVIVHTSRGLVKAHSSGIVHRDLKPENIFLTKGEDGDEVCKILDFGLAKFYAPVNPEEKAAKRLTREGAVFGTPAYMSPEQVKGQGNVDHRADLWALGCMAYECLIGRPVWNMDQGVAMTFAAIATGQIPVPSHQRADLPPEFDAWFAKCLERDPARRYQGAKELADAFVEAWGQRPASSASYPGFNINTGTGSNRILGGASRTGANRAMGGGLEGVDLASEPRVSPSGQEALTRPGSPSPLNGSNPSFPLVSPRASTDMPTTTSRPDVVPQKKPTAFRYALGGLFLTASIAASVFVWFRFLGPQVLTPIVKSSATAPASGTASTVDLPPPNESKWQTTLADGQRLFSNGDVGDAQRKFKEAGEIGGAGVMPIARWFLDQSRVPTDKGNPAGACKLGAIGRPRASTERRAERPAVAALSKGALVTWVDDHERPSVSHVFGVVVDPTGRAISPVRDLSPEAVEANRPQLASIGADRLVLLYWDEKGKEAGVRARLIDGTGNIDGNKGDSVRIGGAKAGQFWPAISNGPDGFYVVWQDDRDGIQESELFVRHLTNELETKSNETRLTDYVTVPRARFGAPRVRYPSLAVSAGNLIIAYKLENDRDKSRAIIRMRVPIGEAEKGLAPDTSPSRPDRVAGDVSMVSEDKVLADAPSIACGNDGCYIAWHVDSKDGGASIAKIDPKENRVIFRKKFAPTGAHPVLASNDGVVSVAWYEKPFIKFTTLNDAGPILPATSVAHIWDVTNPRPSIAPGANKNEWYMTWTDSDVPKGQTEVYEARVTCKMSRFGPLAEATVAAAVVTGIVTVASIVLPDKYVATVVGFVFLGATWLFVWRRDDAYVEANGLALGGLVLPGKLDVARLVRSGATALAWALLLCTIFFVPFYFGWRRWWHPHGPFSYHPPALDLANDGFGQLVIIALPEEAFYRGYLQSRLDVAFPQRVRILGAEVGPSLVVTSLIFALGHLATIHEPTRLAVFFPSLVFGWLRYRTRGIGAGLTFHALCNVFSEILGRGYHLYG